MHLEIISYHDLQNTSIEDRVRDALYNTGIIGIRDVPGFVEKTQQYLQSAQQFARLPEEIKKQYAPNRDAGNTEGYELGAEWFKDENDNWKIDDKKSSYYAYVPDHDKNQWPREVDIKTTYLALGELIFATGKKVLNFIGINEKMGIPHEKLTGYGRMLHYHMDMACLEKQTHSNEDWCGAHFDHGVFTGLVPAYYFRDGVEIDEPDEAGLFIYPTNGTQFEKVPAQEKNILLFQVGEFAQLASHDQICATKHIVKKAKGNIERYAFALFYIASCPDLIIQSKSKLSHDERYLKNCFSDKSISYDKWAAATYARFRAV